MASDFVDIGGGGSIDPAEIEAIAEAVVAADVPPLIDAALIEAAEYTDDEIAALEAALANTKIQSITFSVDGSGAPLTTGIKARIVVPYACTINSATILAAESGNLTLDVLKSDYATFPTTASICAAAKPALSGVQKSQDTTLTGWTTSVAAGDVLELEVEGTPTVTWASLTLKVTKT